MTLRQIASAIRNHVVDGIKGVTNEAFSMEQLMLEALIESKALIAMRIREGVIDPRSINQRIDGIEINCQDTSNNCEVKSQLTAPHITIPKLLVSIKVSDAIEYLGPMDNSKNFRVYTDIDYKYNKYTLTGKSNPYVWINTSGTNNGMYDVYFFNMGKYNNLKFVSIIALFENPDTLMNSEYGEQFRDSEFFAPSMIQKEIIDTLTQKYVNYYRQLNRQIEPNTQEKY
ncbi:MAG: hypothetical protein KAH32_04695 [Chlamydiia bacterium]|nr:hypothetical protein [Chlamydiia bacterium]